MSAQVHTRFYGFLAEFETPEQILAAAKKSREAGYRQMEAYTPMPVEGLAEAIGFRSMSVQMSTLIGAIVGGLSGFGLEYWVAVITYPINVAGRPLNSWPAFIPVTFELTVLGAALSAVFGMLALNRLPMPHHPVFNVERFSRASTDRFFLEISAHDPKFHKADTARFLQDLGAQHV